MGIQRHARCMPRKHGQEEKDDDNLNGGTQDAAMVTTDVDIAKWPRFDVALMEPSTSREKPGSNVKLVL